MSPEPAIVARGLVRRFGELSFPEPEGGVVVVTYPIRFSPRDGP